MSTVSDALAALKNVVLMQERLDVMRRDLGELSGKVDKLNDRVIDINYRVIRIETLINVTRGGGASPPLING